MPFVDDNADVHTCSYFCDRPECIKRQRDELRDRMELADELAAGWRRAAEGHQTNAELFHAKMSEARRENARLHEWLAGSMGGKPDEQ